MDVVHIRLANHVGYAQIDACDYERELSTENRAGRISLCRICDHKWHTFPSGSERNPIYYAYSKKLYVRLSLHRLVLCATRDQVVDHRDNDGLNCCRSNLRLGNQSQNGGNRRLNSNNRTGFKGLVWIEGRRKYQSAIRVAGKRHFLGSFQSAEDAARAYDAAARELFGEFASVNFKT